MASYTIDSVQDLIDLTLLSGKFNGISWGDNVFTLTTDLDLTGVDPANDGNGWLPIGTWGGTPGFFNGSFDGSGHIISNMTINRPASDNVGFIGAIDVDADGATPQISVQNLMLSGIAVSGGANNAGGLMGAILGDGKAHQINNCACIDGIVIGLRRVGGIVGFSNNGYFSGCYTNVEVRCPNSNTQMGGFIGNDTIGTDCINCYSAGIVNHEAASGADTYIGGFIGEADATYATGCYFDKTVATINTDGINGDAIGETTANMKTQGTFTGWDFTNIWWMPASDYPKLKIFSGVLIYSSSTNIDYDNINNSIARNILLKYMRK